MMNGRLAGLVAVAAAAAALSATDAFVVLPGVQTTRRPAGALEASTRSVEDTAATFMGKAIATAALALAVVLVPSPAFADGQTNKFKLPPVDLKDKARCQFQDSKMGQANAQRDKVRSMPCIIPAICLDQRHINLTISFLCVCSLQCFLKLDKSFTTFACATWPARMRRDTISRALS